MEQRPDSVPSSTLEPEQGGPQPPSPWGPADTELIAAMDASETQCEEEAAEEARAVDTAMDTVGGTPEEQEEPPLSGDESQASHRRRRLHAAVFDRHGGFHQPEL